MNSRVGRKCKCCISTCIPKGHTFAKDPENSVSSSRSRVLKMLRQTRRSAGTQAVSRGEGL